MLRIMDDKICRGISFASALEGFCSMDTCDATDLKQCWTTSYIQSGSNLEYFYFARIDLRDDPIATRTMHYN